MRRTVLLTLVLVAALLGAQVVATPPTAIERLRQQIEQAMRGARGDMGVAIKFLESGQQLEVNADQTFPMASTFKLPVLVELYAQQRAGKVDLDEEVELKPLDQHLGSGDIAVYFDLPGVRMTVRNVANMMMMISDNSAADLLLTKVGAANVNARLRSLGLNSIRVDRTCQELILDFNGADTEKLKGMLLNEMRPYMPRGRDATANETKFVADPRDQASPRDMVGLLEKLYRGQAVDAEASKAILDLMKRCRTGAARIKGMLPSGTVVAHKTGSLPGIVDDVGIIYLPNDAGHVAIAVLSKRTRAQTEDVEHAIAEIARYAFDYFYFTTAPAGTAQ